MSKKLITNFITTFNEDLSIDYSNIEMLVKNISETEVDAINLFSLVGEGPLLQIDEKIEILNYVKEKTKLPIIYSLYHVNINDCIFEMDKVNKENLIFYLHKPYLIDSNQEGILEFYNKIIEKYKNCSFYVDVEGMNVSQVKRLMKSHNNVIGIVLNKNKSVEILKNNLNDINVLLDNDEMIYEGLENGIKGIFSNLSISFSSIIREILDDYEIGFKNNLIISYMKLVYEIFSELDYPVNIKYYLSIKGYKNIMNFRLPNYYNQSYISNYELLI